ncbi:MAG: hypothetical protein IID60_11540 [Proteobacteria bacterium]|nr:hypothetical protein [Pseudomonadota bacterium]
MIFTAFHPAGGGTEVKSHAIDMDFWKKGFYPTYTRLKGPDIYLFNFRSWMLAEAQQS